MRSKRVLLLFLLILLSGILPGIPLINVVECGVEVVETTLSPTDDSYGWELAPTASYGSAAYIQIRPVTGGRARSLLKFDFSGIPEDAQIVEAKLYLYYYQSLDNNPVGRQLNSHRVLGDWNEEEVTWNNQPSHDASIEGYAIVPASFGWMVWNITTLTEKWVDGTYDNYGVKIKDNTEGTALNYGVVWYSKEKGVPEKPYLYVKYLAGTYEVTISNMEGCGDWVFAEERYYYFEAQYNATPSLHEYIDTCKLKFSDGYHTVEVAYKRNDTTWSLINGSEVAKLATGSEKIIDQYTINVTFPIYLLGSVLDSYDIDIYMWLNTTLGFESGWVNSAENYFNIYCEGGKAEYTFTGSSGRTEGGDAWEDWAGGDYSPPDIFWDNFEGDVLLNHWTEYEYVSENDIDITSWPYYSGGGQDDIQSAYVKAGSSTVSPHLNGFFGDQSENLTISLFVQHSSNSQGYARIHVIEEDAGWILLIYFGYGSEYDRIWASNGTSDVRLDQTYNADTWYNLTLTIDMTNQEYDVYWGGSLTNGTGLDFYNPAIADTPDTLKVTSTYGTSERTFYIDYLRIFRDDPGGTSGSATVTALWRKLQAIRFQWAWGIEPDGDGSIVASHSNEGYVEFGIDYCDPFTDAWVTNAWKCRIFINGSALGGSDDWIRLNVTWYNRTGSVIRSDIIYSYWEGKDGTRKYFRMWSDLWFNRLNSSSIVGGRVNSYYFGMHDSSNPWINWITGTAWAPRIEDVSESMYFDDLKDGSGDAFSSRILELMRVRVKVYRSGNFRYKYRLRDFEVVDPTMAKGYMVGLDTPPPEKTQTLNLNQGGLLSGLIGILNSIGTLFYTNALIPFWGWFRIYALPFITDALNTASLLLAETIVPLIDSFIYFLFPALGTSAFTGWLTTLNTIFASLSQFASWLVTSLGYAVQLFTQTMLWYATFFTYFIYLFIRVITYWIEFWTILSGLFTGGYGTAVNIWIDWSGAEWVLLMAIFYPLYLFYRCDQDKSFQPMMFHAKAWKDVVAFSIMLFKHLFDATIGTISFIIESIPVAE